MDILYNVLSFGDYKDYSEYQKSMYRIGLTGGVCGLIIGLIISII